MLAVRSASSVAADHHLAVSGEGRCHFLSQFDQLFGVIPQKVLFQSDAVFKYFFDYFFHQRFCCVSNPKNNV
jgi:hypothetical protein